MTPAHDTPKLPRSKRIEFIITPGKSLGPFKLGSSLWDTLHFLSDKPQFFPSVELKYSHEKPLGYDFIVALPYNGINLRYDGSLQRLKSVECYDPSKGLAFTFPIPIRHQDLYKSSTDLPLEFPDGTTPIASKVILYSNNSNWKQATVPPLSKIIAEHNANNSLKYGKSGKYELEAVIVKPTKGIVLHFPTHGTDTEVSRNTVYNNMVVIDINVTTAQDILADIGKPSKVFYKEEDKMKIHSVSDNVLFDNNLSPTDYFFNYFHLGIDILLDGNLHKCKKIVLHGNIPGHFDFQRYKRCPFQLIFPKENGKNKKDRLLVDVESEENTITADMDITTMQERIPWENSSKIEDTTEQKPVILTRGSSEQNPFGSTYLTGYDEGIVMEVMKNGYVPTLVLY
ncbi:hypothetical protein BDB01DRAFT_731775 [Pilobolus umbonatus]|nr:hypothetical protein BDB01DRAFT_731775 [Pilobolus umbonatus]